MDKFIYKDATYFIEDGKYYRERYGKKLNVKKKEFYRAMEKANENIKRN